MSKIMDWMNVSEVLALHPEFEQIFLAHGLNCVGCPGSAAETIKEAADGHGIDLASLLEDLNKYEL